MNSRFSFFCLAALLFLTGLAPFLFSQESISVDVTAERETEEVPLSSSTSTVITADEIAESGASSIVDVLEKVPGIMFRSPLAASEEITMRGFGENAHGRVLVLVDGNRMNNPDMKPMNWDAVSLMDIERIEILDGGASVRYGNNAVAGVINIITKKSGKTQTNIKLSGGSFWNNQEAISHQQSTDWGRFSVSAEHLGSEGYRDRSAYDTTNAALQGTIDFSDRLSLSLKGSFSDIHYQLPGPLTEIQNKDDPTTAVNWNDEASERHISAGLEFEWIAADNIEVHVPLSYRGLFIETNMPSSWSPYSNRNVHIAEAHPSADVSFDINDFSLDINAGIDFSRYLDVKNYSDIQRKNVSSDSEIDEINSGLYLLVQFQPLQQLCLNAGIRYDFAVMGNPDEDAFQQAFVYEAGAAYKPFDFLNVYAKYATLFRYPFFDEVVEYNGYVVKDLKPEQGYHVEGGIGFDFDTWISLNVNVYYLQLKDEIAFGTAHNENMDETGRLGTNISLTMTPFKFLELWAVYSYVNAEFTGGANKGKIVPMVSAHEVSLHSSCH